MASKKFGLSRTCHSMNPTLTQIEAVSQEANHHQNSTVTPKRQETNDDGVQNFGRSFNTSLYMIPSIVLAHFQAGNGGNRMCSLIHIFKSRNKLQTRGHSTYQNKALDEIRQIAKAPAFLNRHKPKEVVNGSSHKKNKINPGRMHRGKP